MTTRDIHVTPQRLVAFFAELRAADTTPTGPCLTTGQLVAYAMAEVHPARLRRLDAHVEACPVCCELLVRLVDVAEGHAGEPRGARAAALRASLAAQRKAALLITDGARPARSSRRRAVVEGLVALLAFAVWGKLAYIGAFRLLARAEGLAIGGHWLVDAASLGIGLAGSVAGVAALWTIAARARARWRDAEAEAGDESAPDASAPAPAAALGGRGGGRPVSDT